MGILKSLKECSDLILIDRSTGKKQIIEHCDSINVENLNKVKSIENNKIFWDKNQDQDYTLKLEPQLKEDIQGFLNMFDLPEIDYTILSSGRVTYNELKKQINTLMILKNYRKIKHLEIQHIRKNKNKRIQKKIDKKLGYNLYIQLVAKLDKQSNQENEITFNI